VLLTDLAALVPDIGAIAASCRGDGALGGTTLSALLECGGVVSLRSCNIRAVAHSLRELLRGVSCRRGRSGLSLRHHRV
jgi:hypothetical protein